MPRLMYDSVSPDDIPVAAQMVAGYVDGYYAWNTAGWARFPHAKHVRITVTGNTEVADVIDFETGNVSAAQAAAWVKRMIAAGRIPTVYVQASRLNELHAALVAAGVDPARGWNSWVAIWDGRNAPYLSAVAKQYANPALSGGHYDLSWVADYWPGVDPAPVGPPPPPTPVPPPPPGPPAPPSPPLDQARAAWARLGDLLITDFPGTVERIAGAVSKINRLP